MRTARGFRYIAAAMVAILISAILPSPAQAAPDSFWATIQGEIFVLGVAGGSHADGAKVIQWTEDGSPDQRWLFTRRYENVYSIKNAVSGKAMAVNGGRTNNGAPVIQYTYRGDIEDQMWALDETPYGNYRIRNVKAWNKCLAIPNDNPYRGTQAIIWECSLNEIDQAWLLV